MQAPTSSHRFAAAVMVGLGLVAVAPRASAYCRATTCNTLSECTQIPPGCKPLFWKRSCVGIAIQRSVSKELDYATAQRTIDTAFNTWEQANCGTGQPGIYVEDLGNVDCGKVEFNKSEGNANVLVFRDSKWPHPNSSEQLALTTVTFNSDTGEIYNADIEVNTADYTFSDGGQYDLLSVLTHETGHFLGLAHSTDPQATMFAAYDNTTNFRTLEQDDIDGICSIYPPKAINRATCNPIPRHGFSPECGDAQLQGCSATPSPDPGSGAAASGLGLAALGVAAAAAALRRRARA